MTRFVFQFEEGDRNRSDLIGGKGAGLAEMTNIGLPVPPGFTVTTEACREYLKRDAFPVGLIHQVRQHLEKLELSTGKKFGDPTNPLLLSLRSGAPVSMPGMMDTVLNLGLDDGTRQGMLDRTGNPRFVADIHRRFVQMFGDVVLGIEHDLFEDELTRLKGVRGVESDVDLTAEDLEQLTQRFLDIVEEHTGKPFPQDPMDQVIMGIEAVFNSWNNPRAIAYRKLSQIPDDLGTAVNIQTMVFGNTGEHSGSGVAFTRNPGSGEKELFGEYLPNAQGEDVVAGIRTPLPISTLKENREDVFNQLEQIGETLERHYRDTQDIEFTVEEGVLYMLQTRTAKRTGIAALRIAMDMFDEGLIDEKEALLRVDPNSHFNQLFFPIFDEEAKVEARRDGRFLARGLNAGPGAASGRVYFTADDVEAAVGRGEQVLLVRVFTSPEDITGMKLAEGILTSTGGATSHAAVVARGWGKPCVVGATQLDIDYGSKEIRRGDKIVREGEWLSIDGFTGDVFSGELPAAPSEIIQVVVDETMKPEDSVLFRYYSRFDELIEKVRKMGVRTNADTPKDASIAVKLGADGIGLCRTEHMFFSPERVAAFREMILTSDQKTQGEALDKLRPMQQQDFEGIFREMGGRAVTIRLLDPPLHEFLPQGDGAAEELADQVHMDPKYISAKISKLHEQNPMLGHRGCRLGITDPAIYGMQVRAIMKAACNVAAEGGKVRPEIMIPLISHANELERLEELTRKVADGVIAERAIELRYKVGTMIELPRAAITADQVAQHAQFFSFGTNDLTQTTFGLSRDDAAGFLPTYVEKKILPGNPFVSIDEEGVGFLVELATRKGREARPGLKVGICGEHGGDPASIAFCHKLKLNYVSCSPFRVPVARLTAAQCELK